MALTCLARTSRAPASGALTCPLSGWKARTSSEQTSAWPRSASIASRGQKLVGVNFTETDLEGCDFSDVVFEGCHLVGAYISERTRFDRADLRGAFVSGAHLVKASLMGAIMLPSQVNTMVFDGFGIVVFMDDEGD